MQLTSLRQIPEVYDRTPGMVVSGGGRRFTADPILPLCCVGELMFRGLSVHLRPEMPVVFRTPKKVSPKNLSAAQCQANHRYQHAEFSRPCKPLQF